jgi:hypothetical protein
VIESSSQLELPLVLVHGDTWAGNFIFDSEDQNVLLAVIDWHGERSLGYAYSVEHDEWLFGATRRASAVKI